MALVIDQMGKRYGKLPSEIMDTQDEWSDLKKFTFDKIVFQAGIKEEIAQQGKK